MNASIIICTYNRAESHRDTLRALRTHHVLEGRQWEVIVVNNNSNDHTRAVVEEARRDWPSLRYEFEIQQGLSHARIHGIACARGEVFLFTDDDVLLEPDWLETTLAGMGKYKADACSGYIAPIWETPPPTWLTERFYGFLRCAPTAATTALSNRPRKRRLAPTRLSKKLPSTAPRISAASQTTRMIH